MQIRTSSSIAVLVALGGIAASGCQFIAGVAGLEASDEGSGGKQANGADCVDDGECTSGHCTDGICCTVSECSPHACRTDGVGCNTTCTEAAGGCAADGFCDQPPGTESGRCEACGWAPTPGTCPVDGCEACAGSVCTKTCDAPDECTTNLTLVGEKGVGSELHCKDQCNDITVTCTGPNPCEVVCDAGGCRNLQLKCDRIGQCKLTCKGPSCEGATMSCGKNACTATCQNPTVVSQSCGASCGCAKTGCL